MEIFDRANFDLGFKYVFDEYFILSMQKTVRFDFRSIDMSFRIQFGNDLLHLLSNQRELKLHTTRKVKNSEFFTTSKF